MSLCFHRCFDVGSYIFEVASSSSTSLQSLVHPNYLTHLRPPPYFRLLGTTVSLPLFFLLILSYTCLRDGYNDNLPQSFRNHYQCFP